MFQNLTKINALVFYNIKPPLSFYLKESYQFITVKTVPLEVTAISSTWSLFILDPNI